jgi:hypothetical protein
MVYFHWSQQRYRHHPAVANIAGAFVALLITEKNNILIVKSSLRHWQQLPNLFIAPLPTAGCKVNKGPQTELCAPLAIRILIAKSCSRCSEIFKGISEDGGRANFSKIKLCSFLFYKGFSNNPNLGRIHLSGQYL